jgi:hypothetical protein
MADAKTIRPTPATSAGKAVIFDLGDPKIFIDSSFYI